MKTIYLKWKIYFKTLLGMDTTNDKLDLILKRLDKIEKRLDSLELRTSVIEITFKKVATWSALKKIDADLKIIKDKLGIQ